MRSALRGNTESMGVEGNTVQATEN